MLIECSTSSLTLPKPVDGRPNQPTASSGSSARSAEKPAPPGRRLRSTDSQTFWFWVMAAPALIGFVLFSLGPMLVSGYLSLTRFDVVTPPEFIGIDNYLYLMREDPAFWPSVKV